MTDSTAHSAQPCSVCKEEKSEASDEATVRACIREKTEVTEAMALGWGKLNPVVKDEGVESLQVAHRAEALTDVVLLSESIGIRQPRNDPI